jgi:hypothetical protein
MVMGSYLPRIDMDFGVVDILECGCRSVEKEVGSSGILNGLKGFYWRVMKTLDMAGDHVFCASAPVNESHGLASLGHSGSRRVLCSSTPFDTVKTHIVIFHDYDGSD